jgi:hypothetical protein
MNAPDLINGAFEFGAFLAIVNNCRVLLRDKVVRGFSGTSTLFFTLWGFWNILYYPHLGQTASFLAGLLVVTANCAYLGLLLHYRRRAKRNQLDLWRMLTEPPPPNEALRRAAQEYRDSVESGRLVVR